ncbi:MAG: DNA polymerase III subunit gamma/tau, partial [Nitriliruptoraceae bacterium]
MAYLSLYRRYRPNTFAEIIGQRHVVDGLVHALRDDRLAHAYLFTGPRGTGKTSTARILAKAVNCVNGPTPEPCGTCHECDAITRGTSVDVIELDMASHGGVEDARELRERAVFAPATARRKVYILDEVHMASTAAFNALLKLIEEPPGHVLFAMATTDPQKIPATILSRVQRLDLRRIEPADVRTYLAGIIQNEGATVTDDALDALVDKGDGSIRDTLTLTEQVLAYSANQITEEAVATVLGTTPREYLRHAVDALAARDTGQIITLVNDVAAAGGDLRQFTHDLIGHLRDLLVIHAAPTRTDLIAATQSWHDVLADQREQITGDEALHAARALIACLPEQRQRNPRLVLELTLAGIIQDFACDTAGPTPPVSPAT